MTFDEIALQLRELRARAGSPSYADVARLVAETRESRGIAPHAARPARSTIYDAFRTGRRRLDADLVADIVRALGCSEAEVEQWRLRCRSAVVDAGRVELPQPTGGATEAVPVDRTARSRRFVAVVLMVGVLINLLDRVAVDTLHLPLFLDMVGTAIAAVLLGPWCGVAVGLATNLIGATYSGWTSIPFSLVNVTGALLWGYGVHRLGFGRTLVRYLALNLVTGLACTLVAVPIVFAVYEGWDPRTTTTGRFLELGHSFVIAVFSANLITSLADKLISGFAALVAADVVHQRRDPHLRTPRTR